MAIFYSTAFRLKLTKQYEYLQKSPSVNTKADILKVDCYRFTHS